MNWRSDLNAEVEYSLENAEVLVSNSTEFDTWLNDIVFDLDNFRTESKGRESETTEEAIPES